MNIMMMMMTIKDHMEKCHINTEAGNFESLRIQSSRNGSSVFMMEVISPPHRLLLKRNTIL